MRYNITSPRKYTKNGEEKTQWMRVGVAFENDKGGLDIQLDALPLPEADRKNEGQMTVRLKAFPDDGSRGGGGRKPDPAPAPAGGSDDIPF